MAAFMPSPSNPHTATTPVDPVLAKAAEFMRRVYTRGTLLGLNSIDTATQSFQAELQLEFLFLLDTDDRDNSLSRFSSSANRSAAPPAAAGSSSTPPIAAAGTPSSAASSPAPPPPSPSAVRSAVDVIQKLFDFFPAGGPKADTHPSGDAKESPPPFKLNDLKPMDELPIHLFWPNLRNEESGEVGDIDRESWIRPANTKYFSKSVLLATIEASADECCRKYLRTRADGDKLRVFSFTSRFKGKFFQVFDLRTFPVDSQILKVSVSLRQDARTWVFATRAENDIFFGKVKEKFVDKDKESSPSPFFSRRLINGINGLYASSISEYDICLNLSSRSALTGKDLSRTGVQYAVLDILTHVRRRSAHYLYNIALPAGLTCLCSLLVFYLHFESSGGDRLAANSALLLAAFSFKAASSGYLPRLGYVTLLEHYTLSQCIFVLAVLFASVSIRHCSMTVIGACNGAVAAAATLLHEAGTSCCPPALMEGFHATFDAISDVVGSRAHLASTFMACNEIFEGVDDAAAREVHTAACLARASADTTAARIFGVVFWAMQIAFARIALVAHSDGLRTVLRVGVKAVADKCFIGVGDRMGYDEKLPLPGTETWPDKSDFLEEYNIGGGGQQNRQKLDHQTDETDAAAKKRN